MPSECDCPRRRVAPAASQDGELMSPFGMGPHYNSWNLRPGADSFKETQPTAPFSDYRDLPFRFDVFYSIFPEFKGAADYPETLIAAAAKEARMYIRPSWCRELDGPDREYALNLATAHCAVLAKKRQAGLRGSATPGTGNFAGADAGPGVVTSASVGGVSVTKTQLAQVKNFWEEWFYQTAYGRQLLVFLSQSAPAGLYYEGGENPASWLRP